MQNFEQRLTGGHPNSLGNTIEVVDEVLNNNSRFDELFNCYFSDDEIVRLRVSNAMKRICKANRALLLPYLDRFLNEISKIDQPSTKWTLAQLFEWLDDEMSLGRFDKAVEIVKYNLETEPDWIVLNNSMESLSIWSKNDAELKSWLIPRLEKLKMDPRKSVAKRANKFSDMLTSD
jgi:hypothetical protein